MSEFLVKDSGERQQFESGMVRDTTADKIDYSLVYDGPMLSRWADHITKGGRKYTKRNWMKARGQAEYDRFIESACRHFAQWIRGDQDEDHAAAVFFNINGAEHVLGELSDITPQQPNAEQGGVKTEPLRAPLGRIKRPKVADHCTNYSCPECYEDTSGNI